MVKISDLTHMNGMPVMKEVEINLGSISITMKRDAYQELLNAIGGKAAEDYAAACKVYDKYWERVKATSELIKDIRDVFYDGEDCDDFFLKREPGEIKAEKLDEILNRNARLLGFE